MKLSILFLSLSITFLKVSFNAALLDFFQHCSFTKGSEKMFRRFFSIKDAYKIYRTSKNSLGNLNDKINMNIEYQSLSV